MTLVHRLRSMVRWLFFRSKAERDMQDELQSFLEMAAAEQVRDGVPLADAHRQAVLHLGGVEQTRNAFARAGAVRGSMNSRAMFATRFASMRNPGLAASVAMMLALGIGPIRRCSASSTPCAASAQLHPSRAPRRHPRDDATTRAISSRGI